MQKIFHKEVEGVYVILKVDNAIDIRNARITQVTENPWKQVLAGNITITCDGQMRAFWNNRNSRY